MSLKKTQQNRIQKLRSQGYRPDKIAELVKCTSSEVHSFLRKQKGRVVGPPRDTELYRLRNQALADLEAGYVPEIIKKVYGVDQRWIDRKLREIKEKRDVSFVTEEKREHRDQ